MSAAAPNHAALVAHELSLPLAGVKSTLELLAGGATVPFISRYRKEATGGLDDEAISRIAAHAKVVETREDRRATILASLKEQGVLTPALEKAVLAATALSALEDLYLPFRPKRRTRAMTARERGLQPLADVLLAQGSSSPTREALAAPYISAERELHDSDAVWAGARDIVAEQIAERPELRATVRKLFVDEAQLVVEVARGKSKAPELAKFADHVGRRERASQAPSHRVLAAERGEAEGMLKVSLELDLPAVQSRIRTAVVKRGAAPVLAKELELALTDSAERLLLPSLESERRRELKERADADAIAVFARNLHDLLLAAPLGGKPVVAIDPGLRTGCKVVALDPRGEVKAHDTIYPHTGRESEAAAALAKLVEKAAPVAIAIGNGTAGRETEVFVKKLQASGVIAKTLKVVSVSEAGASVYSASEVAREELPSLDVTLRGAVSIGRRLQDPLAELVKIDPKSIGVGQYQHDVDQPALSAELDRVVETVVNRVGVDLNTASPTLLRAIAGLGPALATAIVAHRAKHGAFETRAQLREVPRLGARAYEQCAGFLRVAGPEPLDASAVHPERYGVVAKMAKDLGVTKKDLVGNAVLARKIDVSKYLDAAAGLGLPTLGDIVKELEKPGRDPRAEFVEVGFDPDITELAHVKPGQVLNGVVTNVAAFGAFVDIGVHQDGLVHVSELANRFVKDPSDVVKVGERVKVKVLTVDAARKRIALSIKALQPGAAHAHAPPPQQQQRAAPQSFNAIRFSGRK
ncbi:MAG: RNA-binding transcriptional accessory protein [Myxococcaceae bacterium]|nr:RNA-binding transcriptional accessory protein [Myxococcaceae bacterium]